MVARLLYFPETLPRRKAPDSHNICGFWFQKPYLEWILEPEISKVVKFATPPLSLVSSNVVP